MRPGEQPALGSFDAFSAKQVHIVRSTYRVIARRGVERMSLQDVADEAEVSKGIILYHFKTKQNLALTTMRWVLRWAEEGIRTGLERATMPADKIVAVLDELFVQPEATRDFYLTYIELLDQAARFESFSQLHTNFGESVNALYAQVIETGVAHGAFAVTDVEEAASVVRAIIDGLFVQWLQERDWRGTYARYREVGTRAVLAYLQSAPVVAQT